MELAPLYNNETPGETFYETFEIKQDDKTYIINIKYFNNNITLNISEEKLFFEIYQTKLTLNEIKLLNKSFSSFSSCQDFLEYLRIAIKNKLLSINKKNSEQVSIYLKKSNVLFELTKQNSDFNTLGINIYEMISKLKASINNISTNYENIIKENKNIKADIKKINEENKKLKEENVNILNENIKLKEQILNLKKNEIQKEEFTNLKKDINRLIVENKDLKNEFNKLKENKEIKRIIEDNIKNLKQEINKLSEQNKNFKNKTEDLINQNKNIKDEVKFLKEKSKDNLINQIKKEIVIKDKNDTLEINKSERDFNKKRNNIKLISNRNEQEKSKGNPFIKRAPSLDNTKKYKNKYSLNRLQNSLKKNNENKNYRTQNNFRLNLGEINISDIKFNYTNNYLNKKIEKPRIINSNENKKEKFSSIFNMNKINNNFNKINLFNNRYNKKESKFSDNAKELNVEKSPKKEEKNKLEIKADKYSYINPTLQCFANIEQLNQYFLSKENETKICKNKLSKNFLEVIKNIKEYGNIKDDNLLNFKKLIVEMNSSFKEIKDNAPKDLILFLVETMHNELNKVKNDSNYKDDQLNIYDIDKCFQSYERYFLNNFKSVFSDNFYGIYDTQVKQISLSFTSISHKINYFNIMIFELEEVKKFKNIILNDIPISINKCFEYYQRNETITKNNQKNDNINNNKNENMISYKEILTTPKILIINLITKKKSNINFLLEKEISIGRFVHYKNYGYKYRLIGVISKQIYDEKSERYISFYKNFKNHKWYKFDNSVISKSSFEEAKNMGNYNILFYSKI